MLQQIISFYAKNKKQKQETTTTMVEPLDSSHMWNVQNVTTHTMGLDDFFDMLLEIYVKLTIRLANT